MTNPARKHRDERRLAERYTLRRRVQSAKFTRAGDRHTAHGDDADAPVSAPDSEAEIHAPPASTDEEVRL